MSAVWPASLPAQFALDGFAESGESPTIRSTVDVGPAKLRPRYTAEVKTFQVSTVLTSTQADTLETFWQSTLAFGSLPFDGFHPRTGGAVSLRFTSRPQYVALSGNYYRVTFGLEIPL